MDERARDFGRYLHRIRTEMYDESLREFSKRIDISPSYINKMELAEVATPKRDTVIKIAQRLAMEPDALLLKAGFLPDTSTESEDDRFLLLLVGTLTPPQREAVVEFIRLAKDANIVKA